MTFIGKMILVGLSGTASTTGIAFLVVNKDKLFETNVAQNDGEKDNKQEIPRDNIVNTESQNTVQTGNLKNGSPEEKDYICRFNGEYDEGSNKKKIKGFLEDTRWSTKIAGIQILGEEENNFTCAKDMNDNDLESVFEYLKTDKDVESGLLTVVGRKQGDDNVIALRKNGENWTIFGRDNEDNSEEVLSPIKKNKE